VGVRRARAAATGVPLGDALDGTRLKYCTANCVFDWVDDPVDDGYDDTVPVGNSPAGAS
jgi:hypothetical protein